MAQVASFPGDSSGASGASSDSEEESSSLASASSPAKLPDFVCQAVEDGDHLVVATILPSPLTVDVLAPECWLRFQNK